MFAPDNEEWSFVHSENIWFETVSETELAEHFSQNDDGDSFAEKARKLLNEMDVTQTVDIQLVGFDGDGQHAMEINPSELLQFLDAAGANLPFQVQTLRARVSGAYSSQSFPFSVKQVFRVTKSASSELIQTIHQELSSSLGLQRLKREVPIPSHYIFPSSDIESRLTLEHLRSKVSASSFTLYLINPIIPEYQPSKSIRYTYSFGEFSAKCSGVSGISKGKDGDLGFAWVDLSAGPVTFGPTTSGEGIVTEYSFPRVDRLFRKPVTPSRRAQFLSELATTVIRFARHVLQPPVSIPAELDSGHVSIA